LLFAFTVSAAPIHDAARKGDVAAVRKLLADDPSQLEAIDDYTTPLVVAARAGRLAVVKLLVARGADTSAEGHGYTALNAAAWDGSLAVVKYLREHAGADYYARGAFGDGLLGNATKSGSVPLLDYLLKAGIDFTTCKDGIQSVLHAAACGGSLPMVKLLLSKGADPKEIAALEVAAKSGSLPIVQLWLDKGA